MSAGQVINIEGIICPLEVDVIFNEWYDEEYIPNNMKFKGLIGLTRSKLVRSTAGGTTSEYPQYLTTFRFGDIAAFKEWNASPELAKASKNWADVCAKKGVRFIWRAQYETLKSWKNTPPYFVTTLVATVVPPEGDSRFDSWYSDKHIPELLEFKELQGAIRYRFASSSRPSIETSLEYELKEYPKYLTYYYFEDVPGAEAYDTSPEREVATQGWLKIVKETGVERVWRAQYMAMRTWQK